VSPSSILPRVVHFSPVLFLEMVTTSVSERQLPIAVALLCIFAFRSGYPIHARNTMLSKHQTQLCAVFLNMPHTV
jgi:hypothetical protein